MEYSTLAELYEKLESVPSKLSKTDIIAEFINKVPTEDLSKVVLLIQGRVFPSHSEFEFGIASQMMIKSIVKATGLSTSVVEEKFKKTGDLGLTAEKCIESKK